MFSRETWVSIAAWRTLSKALCRSNPSTARLSRVGESTTSCLSSSIASCVPSFALKPTRVLGYSSAVSRYSCHLFSNTCSSTLPTQDVSDIGRRLSTCGGLPGLGIRTVFASFHCLGSLPERQHSLKQRVSAVTPESGKFRSILFVTLSGPAADLQLIVCNTARTSHSSMSLSRRAFSSPAYPGNASGGVAGR